MWTLAITSTPRDVMSMVGMVILVGIVVNNAIVLVDAMNRARLDGADMFTAVLNSGRERLRPIMMTALTTVGGLLPLAMGTVEIAGVSYAPLARTVIGGLVASTMVTLVFVPLTYTLFSNLGHVLTAAWQQAVAGKSSR
jgi:HAE1 family hydrophobic/amphiphilic exporter-1